MAFRRITFDANGQAGTAIVDRSRVYVLNDSANPVTIVDGADNFTLQPGTYARWTPESEQLAFVGTPSANFLFAWGDFQIDLLQPRFTFDNLKQLEVALYSSLGNAVKIDSVGREAVYLRGPGGLETYVSLAPTQPISTTQRLAVSIPQTDTLNTVITGTPTVNLNAIDTATGLSTPLSAQLVGTVETLPISGQIGDNTAAILKVPVLPARANAAAPTWTEANSVPLSTDLAGNLRVSGIVGDNQFAAVKLPVTPARANAAAPAWTEGNTVPLSTDLSGNLRVSQQGVIDVSDRAAREVGRAREWGNSQTQVSNSSAAPGASAVLADTGALAAGDYDFDVAMAILDTNAVGKGMVVEHRNAANAATLFQLGGCASPGNQWLHIQRKTLALNERIRVIAGTAAGAASSLYISAIARRTAG
jgi:hypothetical protein